MKFDFN